MKLSYRGIEYDYTPPTVKTADTTDLGKYRGVDIRFRAVTKNPVQQPTLDLVYRGVAFRTGDSAEAASAVPTGAKISEAPHAALNVEEKARVMMMGHHRNVKRRQQVMLARMAADVGLNADVTRYWNHIQGKVHPSFWATYDRSRVASS